MTRFTFRVVTTNGSYLRVLDSPKEYFMETGVEKLYANGFWDYLRVWISPASIQRIELVDVEPAD